MLFRPFCIAEIYHAIQAGKAIVLVTEEDGARPGLSSSSHLVISYCAAGLYGGLYGRGRRVMCVAPAAKVSEEDGRAGFDWDLDKFEAEIARATTDVAGELGRGRASH